MIITEIVDPIEVYNRVIINKPYGKNLKPYTKKILLNVINSLENDEEYEKCQYLLEYIKRRFRN